MSEFNKTSIIQEVISEIKDDTIRTMYQNLPKRIMYPIKWDTVKVISHE